MTIKKLFLEQDPKQVKQQVEKTIVWDSSVNHAEYRSTDQVTNFDVFSSGVLGRMEFPTVMVNREDAGQDNLVTNTVHYEKLLLRKHGKHSIARAARAQAKARKRRR